MNNTNDNIDDECFYCHSTGYIHTEDDVPDRMCPNCEIGQAVIKGFNAATNIGIQACCNLREAKDERIKKLEAENKRLREAFGLARSMILSDEEKADGSQIK